MKNEEQIGFHLKELGRLLDRNIMQKSLLNSEEDSVTAMHGWMLGYIYHNMDREIYQKDFESEFHLAKSSVTAALQSLEKSGYIDRVPVEHDARLKKIVLTEKGLRFHDTIEESIQYMEERLTSGLSEKQRKDLFEIFGLIKAQLEEEIATDRARIKKESNVGV